MGSEVLSFAICGLLHLCARISCSCVRVQQLEISTLAPPYSDTLRTRLRTPCALLSRRFSGRFSHATTMAASCLLVTACTLAVALLIAVDKRVHANFQPGGVARSAAQDRGHLFFRVTYLIFLLLLLRECLCKTAMAALSMVWWRRIPYRLRSMKRNAEFTALPPYYARSVGGFGVVRVIAMPRLAAGVLPRTKH